MLKIFVITLNALILGTIECSDLSSNVNETAVIYDYRFYLDNLLSLIKEQKWTGEEEICLNDIVLVLNSVRNSTFWAFWKWDSMVTNPYSIMYGTQYQLGNFDQCLSTLWSQDLTPQTQYCLVDVMLQGTKTNRTSQDNFAQVDPYSPTKNYINTYYKHSRPADTITYGVCVPQSCAAASVKKFVRSLAATSSFSVVDLPMTINVGDTCQDGSKMEFDAVFYSFIIISFSLVCVTVTCTFISREGTTCNLRNVGVISAFSLERNSKNLLKKKAGDLDILYGIRYLTMIFIVFGHQLGMNSISLVINGRNIDEQALSATGALFMHFDVFVDTFYMMSGLLTVTNFLPLKRAHNPVVVIFRRYIRLVAGVAVMVFYTCGVYSHTGSGPLWPTFAASEEGPCRRNWWLNLLMINNYINTSDTCILVYWYIPTDFQFFLIAVTLWYIYRLNKRLAIIIATILAIASTIGAGVVTYIHDLAPIPIFTYDFLINQRTNKEFHMRYTKTHLRFSSYYIGMAAGYILHKSFNDDHRKPWSTKWSVIGATVGFTLMISVMGTGGHLISRELTVLESALYAALNRPVWVFGLVLIIFSCSLGSVPLLSQFLCWYPWVPLSRLSYGLYLVHSSIILRNVFISRQPQYMDKFHILTEAIGITAFGTVLALLLWLLVEAPINNIVTYCVTPRKSGNKSASTENTSSDTKGQITDHQTPTIEISKI